MKTTVGIPMHCRAKLAAREGVTLRTLVERGLHRVISDTQRGAPFKLRRASFTGKGRQAELNEASWATLRDIAYKGHGA